ncbi:response regulator [Spirosoma sp. HMF4905]|uniref:Response regulator n=1 Tax=Spirosoma arboris TaxID=2682092 RepID=A0A7K1SR25_9BACT|nr:response regulator [Spirosoma arboris]MVM36200.1 response regulator [Spirosoma arboris]
MNKTYHVLVVDDDPDDQLFIQMAFEQVSIHYRIQLASNGLEGLNYIENNSISPDLILLDLNMPFLNGFDMLAYLKQSPRYRHLPIVILTTSDDSDDIDKGYDLGVNSFITKPNDFQALTNIIQTIHFYWFEIVKTPARLPVIGH